MIITSENREAHLRSKSKFYVAGWVANEGCENPQTLPESCKDNPIIVEQHKDYLNGYGDCVANGECIMYK
jgi:hypothetical protein|tara:strand:+ start:1423 stop:1632 length:210 start_codon:yes stop_codon:yes gene_type:complete